MRAQRLAQQQPPELARLVALQAAQESGDVLEANRLLQSAYQVDVRPMLAELRRERDLPEDPYRAYLDSGEPERRAAERVGGVAASW